MLALGYHVRMRNLMRPNETLKQSLSRSRFTGQIQQHPRLIAKRATPVILFFTIAFILDQVTQQQYSAVLGSAAIAGSILGVFPALLPAIIALGGYGAIWLGFNVVRAVADDAGLAVASRTFVSSVETPASGGSLPSQWLQERFHDPETIQIHDIALAVVHASFFIIPFLLGAMLWWKRRAVFHQYTWATAVSFALGLVAFLLLPTAPPWLSEPESVTRITIHSVAAVSSGDEGARGPFASSSIVDPHLAFEPNHVAALPSIHVAAAVLVFLALRHAPARLSLPGIAYALGMTLAVVYLGEHVLLDALLGWVVALVGWHMASGIAARATVN